MDEQQKLNYAGILFLLITAADFVLIWKWMFIENLLVNYLFHVKSSMSLYWKSVHLFEKHWRTWGEVCTFEIQISWVLKLKWQFLLLLIDCPLHFWTPVSFIYFWDGDLSVHIKYKAGVNCKK